MNCKNEIASNFQVTKTPIFINIKDLGHYHNYIKLIFQEYYNRFLFKFVPKKPNRFNSTLS